jgi:hypothetical protein
MINSVVRVCDFKMNKSLAGFLFITFTIAFEFPLNTCPRPFCLTKRDMSAIHVKPHSLRFLDSNMISFNDNALCWPVNNSLIDSKLLVCKTTRGLICLLDFFFWEDFLWEELFTSFQNCNDAFTWSQPLNIPMAHFSCFRRHGRGKKCLHSLFCTLVKTQLQGLSEMVYQLFANLKMYIGIYIHCKELIGLTSWYKWEI